MKKRNKMLLITSMVLVACGSLCLGLKCYNKVVTEVANKI